MSHSIRQGDIIKTNFTPQAEHEQAGYGPALVVSRKIFNSMTQMPVLCPITNSDNRFPLHISLDDRTKTTGVILCEQVKTSDLAERGYVFIERLPDDILRKVLNIVRQIFDQDLMANF
jgi:mRNA interferase MazF